jgi:hypothetical protein
MNTIQPRRQRITIHKTVILSVVFYDCETWRRIQLDGVGEKKFRSKRNDVTGDERIP